MDIGEVVADITNDQIISKFKIDTNVKENLLHRPNNQYSLLDLFV